MRVLVVHNHYQQAGGEDEVFAVECELLRSRGHDVDTFTMTNRSITGMSPLRLAGKAVWNRDVYRQLRERCRLGRPDIVHFHNTFPLVSPGGYYAARASGAPVIQTLHNYRLLCPNAQFFRSQRVCEDCLGRTFGWPGVVHACYRHSRPASAVTMVMTGMHSVIGTWARAVDRYVALTEFARAKFIEGGLPADRIVVKPNGLAEDPGEGAHAGGYALYVGRLTPEKGVATLVGAWSQMPQGLPLWIIGQGELESLRDAGPANIRWLGHRNRDQVLDAMREATVLLVPSEWYEGLPMVVAEAFATGLPVIASRQGSLGEIILEGETGFHHRSGDAADLAAQVQRALALGPGLRALGRRARTAFERRYSPAANYDALMTLYAAAVAARQ